MRPARSRSSLLAAPPKPTTWRRNRHQRPGTPRQSTALAATGTASAAQTGCVTAGSALIDRSSPSGAADRAAHPPVGGQPAVQRARLLAAAGAIVGAGTGARCADPGRWHPGCGARSPGPAGPGLRLLYLLQPQALWPGWRRPALWPHARIGAAGALAVWRRNAAT